MRQRGRHGCGCYQERQSRFLEPTILFLMWGKKKHGYELLAELPRFGFTGPTPDPGAIYRTLRHLEDVGLVSSEWDTDGTGPAKRIYTLSDTGKRQLELWADSLRQRRDSIDLFLKELELVLNKKESL